MIYGITGRPGSGKTYFMIRLCKYYLEHGRDVFINVKVNEKFLHLKSKKNLFGHTNGLGNLYYWNRLAQFRKVHTGIILMDEAGAYFNSRKWSQVDEEDLVKFQQHRKHGLDIIYSAQNLDFVDKIIRQLTNFVYICHKTFGLFYTGLYEPEYVNNKEKKKCYGRKFYFFDPELARAYDTFESVKIDFEKEYISNTFVKMNTFFGENN